MRPHTRAEAEAVLDTIARWQARFLSRARAAGSCSRPTSTTSWRAGRSRRSTTYEGFAQHENGIGMARTFEAEVHGRARGRGRSRPTGHASGLLRLGRRRARRAGTARRAPARRRRPPRGDAPRRRAAPSRSSPASTARGCSPRCCLRSTPSGGYRVRLLPVENHFFGGNIGVTGLLTGADVAGRSPTCPPATAACCPTSCCPSGRFLDGLTVADLPRPVEVDRAPTAPPSWPRCDEQRRGGYPPSSERARATASPTAEQDRGCDGDQWTERPGAAPSELGPSCVAVVGRPNVGQVDAREPVRRAARTRSSRSARASRATARSSSPSGPAAASASSTPAAGSPSDPALPLEAQISRQAERAMADADVILFVVDVDDRHRSRRTRRSPRSCSARASPCSSWRTRSTTRTARSTCGTSSRLGLGDPYPVSAIHGRGSGDLLDALVAALPPEARGARAPRDDGMFSIAIVGRPERRQVDAVQPAGRRRPLGRARHARHDPRRDRHDRRDRRRPAAVRRHRRHAAPEPGRRADRVLQPACARCKRSTRPTPPCSSSTRPQGVTHQDQRLAERIDAAGTAIVIVLNKWDLLDAEQREQVIDRRRRPARVPRRTRRSLKLSALTGRTSTTCSPRCARPRRRTTSGCRPAKLNRVIQDAQERQPPPLGGQAPAPGAVRDPGRDRPADLHAVHHPRSCPQTYLRYLERTHPRDVRARARRRSRSGCGAEVTR